MKKAEEVYQWFSKLSFTEQYKLSDKYTNSRNPSTLTKQEVLEIHLEEVNNNIALGDVIRTLPSTPQGIAEINARKYYQKLDNRDYSIKILEANTSMNFEESEKYADKHYG